MNSQADKRRKRVFAYSPNDATAKAPPCKLTEGRIGRIHATFVHGILSTEMIHALVDPNARQDYTTNELRGLKRSPNGYIHTPRGQFRTMFARSNTLYYSCTQKGVEALLAHGRITEKEASIWAKLNSRRKPSEFFHDAATGYLTASAELWARENGIAFLSLYDILRDRQEQDEPLAIKVAKGHLVPDTVWAFQEGESNPVLFIDETDMGSEQHEPSELNHATITHKYTGYRYMLYHDSHETVFGISAVKILFMGTKRRRLSNLKETFKKIASADSLVSGIGPMYLRCVPAFNPELHIKLPPTSMMLAEPWERVQNEPTMLFKLKAA